MILLKLLAGFFAYPGNLIKVFDMSPTCSQEVIRISLSLKDSIIFCILEGFRSVFQEPYTFQFIFVIFFLILSLNFKCFHSDFIGIRCFSTSNTFQISN